MTDRLSTPVFWTGPALAAGFVLITVVAVDPFGFLPFGSLRWMVSTAVALLAILLRPERPVRIPRLLAAGWAVLLVSLALSMLMALDPVHAWVGTPDRRLGLLTWAGLAALFVVGAGIRASGSRWTVIRAAVVACACLGLGTALEALGWIPSSGFTDRLGGSFGQPAYLAAAATLLVPVAVGTAVDGRPSNAWRVTAAVAALSGSAALLASMTRGAWVGLGLACLLALPKARAQVRRRPRVTGLVAMAVATTVAVVLLTTPVGPRLISGLDLTEGTAQGRIDEWRVAGRVIAERPVLGTGPEGYRTAFPAVVDAEYGRRYGRQVTPDRAHNAVLDTAATGGIGAGVGAMALLFGVLALAWRARHSDPILLGVGVGVAAYGLQQQFLFPVAELDGVWWLLVGLLAAAVTSDRSANPIPTVVVRAPPGTRLVVTVLLGAAVTAGGLGVVADRRMAAARDFAVPPTTSQAADVAAAAVRLRPDDIRLWFAAARIAERGGRIIDVDTALDRIESGLAISPNDPALRTEQARLLLERARRSQSTTDTHDALRAFEALTDRDPNNVATHAGLATANALAGRVADARQSLETAKELDPQAAELARAAATIAVAAKQ